MVSVAHGGLCHLRDYGLRETQQRMLQRAAASEFLLDDGRPQPVGRTRALHDRPGRHGLAAHEQRNPHRPLVAGHGDLGRRAVFEHIEQRDDAVRREVNIGLFATRLKKRLAQSKGYRFQEWRKRVTRLCRERRQQPIIQEALRPSSSVGRFHTAILLRQYAGGASPVNLPQPPIQ